MHLRGPDPAISLYTAVHPLTPELGRTQLQPVARPVALPNPRRADGRKTGGPCPKKGVRCGPPIVVIFTNQSTVRHLVARTVRSTAPFHATALPTAGAALARFSAFPASGPRLRAYGYARERALRQYAYIHAPTGKETYARQVTLEHREAGF